MAASLYVTRTFRTFQRTLSLASRTEVRCLSFSCPRYEYERDAGDMNDPKHAHWKNKPHPETPTKHHMDMLSPEPVKGKIYEKLPIRVELKAGKTYHFCTCGYSKTQPFCDTSHKAPNFIATRPHHIRYRPLPFKVDETKEYWLCQCKQSNNRPFCDGTHKQKGLRGAA